MKRNPFKGFSTENKSAGFVRLMLLAQGVLLTAAACFLGLIGLYFSTGIHGMALMEFYLGHPAVVILNTLPFIWICWLVWLLCNRAWIGFLTSGVICLLYSFTEYWKLMIRNDPLCAADLAVAGDALQMAGEYVSVTEDMKAAMLCVLGIAVLFFLLFRNARVFRPTVCLAAGGAAALLGVVLYFGVYTSEKVYKSFTVWEELNQWFDNNMYVSRGGIYPFINSIPDAIPDRPEGYKTREAEEMLTEYETDPIPEDKKVSVIMVMLEAFCDLSGETDLITEGDPYESYHRLQAESYHGKLVTNVFAGGTVDTERCVLTGFPELTGVRKASWSYARYFAEQGYSVGGAHAGFADFYRRVHVNRNLGFDEYLFIDNYFGQLTEGNVPMDWVFLPEITRLYTEQIQSGEAVFAFNVTYQNHGPYSEELWESRIPYVPASAVGTGEYGIVNNYLNGVADTANRLMTMADAFRELEEPVVLVFFGDHKPWLDDAYAQLGIDLEAETAESFLSTYETDYLIWGNEAAKAVLGTELTGQGPSISPCFLMNVLFEQCGWEGPSFQKLTDSVMALTPVITTNEQYMERGTLVPEEMLSPEAKEAVIKLRKASCYLAMDSGGALPEKETAAGGKET